MLARFVTKEGHKHDDRRKQTAGQRDARARIVDALRSGKLAARYGIAVVVDDSQLIDDPTGDSLDALLCAVQAAWAWRNREWLFQDSRVDSKEGWVADPKAL